MKPHPDSLAIIQRAFERRGFSGPDRDKAVAAALRADALTVNPLGHILVKNALALSKLGADFTTKLPIEEAEDSDRVMAALGYRTGAPAPVLVDAENITEADVEREAIEERYREVFGVSILEALSESR